MRAVFALGWLVCFFVIIGCSKDKPRPVIAEAGSSHGQNGIDYPELFATYTAGHPIADNVPAPKPGVQRYDISPPLPPGLTFDSKTGAIRGVPTGVSSRQIYRVVARSGAKAYRAQLSIAVVAPPSSPAERSSPKSDTPVIAPSPVFADYSDTETTSASPAPIASSSGETREATEIIAIPKVASPPAKPAPFPGEGTISSPYLISTATQLRQMAEWPSRVFRLANSIDLQNENLNFGIFENAMLDGAGHVLSNFHVSSLSEKSSGQGLFKMIRGKSTIKNLTLYHFMIEAPDSEMVGALAGEISGPFVEIRNVRVVNSVVQGNRFVGGLVGRISSSDLGDINETGLHAVFFGGSRAEVHGTEIVGGLVGQVMNMSIMEGVVHVRAVNGGAWTGGLVGHNSGWIENSRVALQELWTHGKFGGGLVGLNHKDLKAVSSAQILYSYAVVERMLTDGLITSQGLLVGVNSDGFVRHCFASGDMQQREANGKSSSYRVNTASLLGRLLNSYEVSPLIGSDTIGYRVDDSYSLFLKDLVSLEYLESWKTGRAADAWNLSAGNLPALKWEHP